MNDSEDGDRERKFPHCITVHAGRRNLCAALAILALAFCSRLVYLLQIRANPFFSRPIIDAKMYDEQALAIAGGNLVGSEIFYQAPLYAYFLGLIYWLCGHDYFLARLFQIAVGAFNCVLIYAIGRRVFRARIGFIAGVVGAVYGTFVFYDVELLRTSLIVFFSLAALLALLWAAERPSPLRWAGAGVLLGLSAITWETALLFVPCVLFWMSATLRASRRPREIVQYGILLCLSVGAVILPVTLRNYHVSGDVVLISSQGGLNFYIGNNPESDRTTTIQPGEEWEDLVNLPLSSGRITRPSLRSRWFYAQALNYIRQSPLDWLQLMGRKVLLFWHAAELEPNNDILFHRANSPWLALLYRPAGWVVVPFGVVGPLALVGMFMLPAREAKVRLLLLFVLASMSAIVLYHVRARYRLPVVPVLILFAVWAAARFWEGCRGAWTRRQVTAFVLGLLAATVLVNADVFTGRVTRAFPLHTNLGKIHLERNSLDEARAEFLRAIEADPGDYDALVNLGVLQVRQGDTTAALASFQRAIRANPDYAMAHNNLGVWFFSQGYVEQAIASLSRAVEIRPAYAEAHYHLGLIYLSQKKYVQAATELERVLAEKPDHGDARRANERVREALRFR